MTKRVQRSSISATHVEIVLSKEEENKPSPLTSTMSRRQLIAAIKKLASSQFMNTYDVSSTASHGALTRLYDFCFDTNHNVEHENSTSSSRSRHHHRTYATIRKVLQDSELPSELSSFLYKYFMKSQRLRATFTGSNIRGSLRS